MWRMDSLSIGISVPLLWGKGPSYLGCRPSAGARLPVVFQADQIAGNSNHDPLEIMITIPWKP